MTNTEEEFEFGSQDSTEEEVEYTEEDVLNDDFSLEDDYKEPPLLPKSNYEGNVTKVSIDAKSHAILWQVVLDGNGGMQSDGVTPVDGQMVFYRNWMPKASDANTMIKSGTMTKRQWKINALKEFADEMQVNMNSAKEIKKHIEDGDWIGLRVLCKVDIGQYQGKFRNEVASMKQI